MRITDHSNTTLNWFSSMLARFPLPNQDQSKSHHTRRGPPYRSTGPRNLSAQLHKFVYSMRVFDLNAAAPQRLFLVTKQWKIKTGADSLAVHSQRKMIESNHFGATIGMLIRVDLIRPGRRSQVRLSDGHNEFIAYRSSSSSVQVH